MRRQPRREQRRLGGSMSKLARVLALASAAVVVVGAPVRAADPPPPWAFAVNPPGTQPAPDDGTLKHVPGSSAVVHADADPRSVQRPGLASRRSPSDARGRGARTASRQYSRAAYCHLPNGLGRPENSSLAGLPAAYIAQQVADFKTGARKSSEPASLPVNLMIAVAKAVTDDEVKTAADYFSALTPKPWIRVIETDTVPKTRVAGWMLVVRRARRCGTDRPAHHRDAARIWNEPSCATQPPDSSRTCRSGSIDKG